MLLINQYLSANIGDYAPSEFYCPLPKAIFYLIGKISFTTNRLERKRLGP